MKIFRFVALALVAMTLSVGCTNNNGKEVEVIHNSDLVGTWTCITPNYAEALVISADGSVVSYGIEDGEYWENVKGNIVLKGNSITMTFDDSDDFEGHLDVIPGLAFSLITEDGERYTYNYCTEDLTEEIVGMWMTNNAPFGEKEDMMIRTFTEEGKMLFTGVVSIGDERHFVVNRETDYKVVGDMIFILAPADRELQDTPSYTAERLTYQYGASASGDIMTFSCYLPGELVVVNVPYLRIKQRLDLAGTAYDYSSIYVTHVKGLDKEFEFMGYTMNFATMDGSKIDSMLKSVLFDVAFSSANTITYTYSLNGSTEKFEIPIEVEGNKLTVMMSSKGSALRDVKLYAFQDADNCQMHIYMHRDTVVDFYTNMQAFLTAWQQNNDVLVNDAAAVKAIYDSIDEAVESINLSLVMKAKAL